VNRPRVEASASCPRRRVSVVWLVLAFAQGKLAAGNQSPPCPWGRQGLWDCVATLWRRLARTSGREVGKRASGRPACCCETRSSVTTGFAAGGAVEHQQFEAAGSWQRSSTSCTEGVGRVQGKTGLLFWRLRVRLLDVVCDVILCCFFICGGVGHHDPWRLARHFQFRFDLRRQGACWVRIDAQ